MTVEVQIRHTIIGIQGPEGIQGIRGDEGAPGSMAGPDAAIEGNIAAFGSDPTVLVDSGIAFSAIFPVDSSVAQLAALTEPINTTGKFKFKLAADETGRVYRALGPTVGAAWRPGDDQSGTADIIPV